MENVKKCEGCAVYFSVKSHLNRKRFCSDACKKNKHNEDHKEQVSCLECTKVFWAGKKKHQKYCSNECRKLRERKIWKSNNPTYDIPSGTMGAIGELKVCVDLLFKGYYVYRSMSPSCPADLAITCNNKLYRVEVTTGSIQNCGKIMHPKNYMDRSRFDILAIVMKSGEIIYEPSLPNLSEDIDVKSKPA